MDIDRVSLNSMTVPRLSLRELVDHCLRRGIRAVAPWRHLVEPIGAVAAGRIVANAGLAVSSLCRAGMFTAPTAADRAAALDDNRRAIDAAAELGAPVLVLVCGPVVNRDPAGSMTMVREGIEALLPHAHSAGITLGVEPLHPMLAADRSVVTRLDHALRLTDQLGRPESLGIVVDAYHLWWDPDLGQDLDRARGLLHGAHVSDWVSPLSGGLASGRGMPGDGHIDLRRFIAAVDRAGYAGPVEIEVISDQWAGRPADEILSAALTGIRTAI